MLGQVEFHSRFNNLRQRSHPVLAIWYSLYAAQLNTGGFSIFSQRCLGADYIRSQFTDEDDRSALRDVSFPSLADEALLYERPTDHSNLDYGFLFQKDFEEIHSYSFSGLDFKSIVAIHFPEVIPSYCISLNNRGEL